MILTKGLGSYIFPIKHEQPNPEVYTSIIDEIMAFLAKRAYYLAKITTLGRKKPSTTTSATLLPPLNFLALRLLTLKVAVVVVKSFILLVRGYWGYWVIGYSVDKWIEYSVGKWIGYSVGKWIGYSVGKWIVGHRWQVSVPNSIVSCQGKAASNRAQEFIMS